VVLKLESVGYITILHLVFIIRNLFRIW